MAEMTERELLIVNTLAVNFYKIVPTELRTYCSLTSRISKSTLLHFGIEADLLPCQVWLATPENNFVVGFTGKASDPRKWDGHVVCGSGRFIIDAALHHFDREFGLNVPNIAAIPRFRVPTQVIARLDLHEKNGLWWHCPPSAQEIDLSPPDDPPEVIAKYSSQLIEHMSAQAALLPEKLTSNRAHGVPNFSLHKM